MHQVAAKDDGWLAPISNTLDYTLHQIQTGLDQLHVPYSYGWAIIGLTVATKVATFPFTKIQARPSTACLCYLCRAHSERHRECFR